MEVIVGLITNSGKEYVTEIHVISMIFHRGPIEIVKSIKKYPLSDSSYFKIVHRDDTITELTHAKVESYSFKEIENESKG